MQNSLIWALSAVVLALAFIGFIFFQYSNIAAPSSSATSTDATGSSTVTQGGITASGDFTIGGGDVPELDIPDFRAPIRFSSTISAEVRKAIETAVDKVEANLTKDTFDLKSWIDLGALRKMGGDYAGAEKAWIFVSKAAPDNSIAFNNLGDLYMNFTKDYAKAEQAYLGAIKISPAEENPYHELYVLYTNFYKKGTSAAEDILKKGVVAAPDSVDLHVLLARHYKAAGRATEARAEYQAAIAAAKRTGQTEAAAQLEAEAGQ